VREPRSEVGISIAPAVRDQLAAMAAGRALVIDYFAAARCGSVVGDLTATFSPVPADEAYVQVAAVEGVRVFAESRLLVLLEDGGAGIGLAGPRFARHLAVTLERPERWLDFLERPGVCAGKSLWARRRKP
jgi:hypothetical protein